MFLISVLFKRTKFTDVFVTILTSLSLTSVVIVSSFNFTLQDFVFEMKKQLRRSVDEDEYGRRMPYYFSELEDRFFILTGRSELGGKNPAIIFNDADLDKCITTTIRSSFMNQGEICLCTSRLFVQKEIYREFLEKFVAETKKLKVGNPQDENTFTGALISKEHLAKVKGYVEMARQEGADICCGDGVEALDLCDKIKNGYYMRPTVIANVSDTSRLMTEEIFGPVTCVVPFDEEDEVIARANSVKYGLSATVWSQDVSRIHRVAQRVQAGTVWANCWLLRDLNMPFGGVKESGVGREGVRDSIAFYTEEKTICVKI